MYNLATIYTPIYKQTGHAMSASDIDQTKLIFKETPESWHPYIKLARLDRPTGTYLLLLPCLWSIILASLSTGGFSLKTLSLMIAFTLGAFLMRSAGCVINDLWDRDIDKDVARTKNRPLASGELSPRNALIFLACLLCASLVILLSLPFIAIWLGVISLFLVAIYPYMKRITWWPQLFLGITFNWGALMGWAAYTSGLNLSPLFLYVGGILWTLAYDTIYAHQDMEDDARAGIKSTALLFGEDSKTYVTLFLFASILFFMIAKLVGAASIFTVLMTLPLVGHAIWQIKTWDPQDATSSLRIFRANQIFGLLVLLMLCL